MQFIHANPNDGRGRGQGRPIPIRPQNSPTLLFELRKGHCWLSKEVLFKLVSFQDRRCHNAPDQTRRCFWEGDFVITFDVICNQRHIKRVTLNDHDVKYGKWTVFCVECGGIKYKLALAGGPRYATGFTQTGDLVFEISYKLKSFT